MKIQDDIARTNLERRIIRQFFNLDSAVYVIVRVAFKDCFVIFVRPTRPVWLNALWCFVIFVHWLLKSIWLRSLPWMFVLEIVHDRWPTTTKDDGTRQFADDSQELMN